MNRHDLKFSTLDLNHESAIADYVAEFSRSGERRIHGYFGEAGWNHAETVEKLKSWSQGKDLDGWVQNSTWFLFQEGRIVGNYNFRHELTESLKRNGGHCGYSVRPLERRKGYGTIFWRTQNNLAATSG